MRDHRVREARRRARRRRRARGPAAGTEQAVHDAHDHVVDPAADVAGDRPERHRDANASADRLEARRAARPRAPDDPAAGCRGRGRRCRASGPRGVRRCGADRVGVVRRDRASANTAISERATGTRARPSRRVAEQSARARGATGSASRRRPRRSRCRRLARGAGSCHWERRRDRGPRLTTPHPGLR